MVGYTLTSLPYCSSLPLSLFFSLFLFLSLSLSYPALPYIADHSLPSASGKAPSSPSNRAVSLPTNAAVVHPISTRATQATSAQAATSKAALGDSRATRSESAEGVEESDGKEPGHEDVEGVQCRTPRALPSCSRGQARHRTRNAPYLRWDWRCGNGCLELFSRRAPLRGREEEEWGDRTPLRGKNTARGGTVYTYGLEKGCLCAVRFIRVG